MPAGEMPRVSPVLSGVASANGASSRLSCFHGSGRVMAGHAGRVVGEDPSQLGFGEVEQGAHAGRVNPEGVGNAGGIVALVLEAQRGGIDVGQLVERDGAVHGATVCGLMAWRMSSRYGSSRPRGTETPRGYRDSVARGGGRSARVVCVVNGSGVARPAGPRGGDLEHAEGVLKGALDAADALG